MNADVVGNSTVCKVSGVFSDGNVVEK